MATMLFAANLIDVRCWSYHGVGERYTTVARDFASLLRRNGIASHSRDEAKKKWKPVDGAAKYSMPWGWMWFVPRGVLRPV
jgi:FAD/FMN-containing dehydrogenase